MATGMIIDGIAASEAIDSSGEILSVEGCDISDLEEGKGVLNWEHRGEDAHGASPNDIVGAITYAKKIYKAADCEDDRQRMYWDRVKLPLIYVKCRLFDGSGHPGAIALAAMIRDYHSNGQPVLVRYSIEGSTLEKEGNHLKRSVARRVAATIKPCNKSCHSGVLEDPNNPKGESKPAEKDILEDIATRKFEHPSLMRLGGDAEFEVDPLVQETELAKTLTAGSTNAAPGTLTGGAALQREELSERAKKIHEMTNTAKAAVRDWDGNGDFKAFLKSRLPEADDEFLDNFADLAEEYKVKKSMQKSEIDLAELQQLAKFDRLALNLNRLLRKAEDETGIEANPEAPKLVRWQGNLMRPGSAIGLAKNNLNKQVKVLGMDDEDVHVQHPDGRIARWPKDGIGTKFKIHELPERVSSPHLVDATKHHVGAPDADQHALVHGIDLGGDGSFDGRPLYGINARTAEYRKHPDGHTVILKDGGPHSPDDPDFLPQHRSAAYYSLAKNFFGLGEHVPPTAVIKHPATGDVMSAMKKVPNATHMGEDKERSTKALHKLGESGQLEKLGLMNAILGNYDRDNIGNFLFTEQHPHLHLIDHDYTFGEFNDVPAYFHRYLSLKHPDKNLFDPRRWQWQLDMAAEPFQEHLHPEATRWAMSLDPDKFAQELVKAGVPDYYRQKALDRLVNLQTRIHNNGGKIKHAEWLKFLGEDPLVRPA
jgi:hypothetical protein